MSVRVVRLAFVLYLGTFVMFVLGFLLGAIAGMTYTARDKTCAVVESGGAKVPVCEYDYRPPKGWATW